MLRPTTASTCIARTQVVYLNSSPDELFRRLRHDRNRPLLQVADPLQRLRDLYAVRDPLYRETAHFHDRDRAPLGGHPGQHDRDAAGAGGR